MTKGKKGIAELSFYICKILNASFKAAANRVVGCARFSFVVAAAVWITAPATSSASGEQPKFLAPQLVAIPGVLIENAESEEYLVAMRPERDIEDILKDTFDEAARSGSAGALLKFISRHPDHPLAEKARRMLEEGDYPPARKTATDWVDSKIVEFDAARRSGPAALRAFIAKHPDHPLADEARRMLRK